MGEKHKTGGWSQMSHEIIPGAVSVASMLVIHMSIEVADLVATRLAKVIKFLLLYDAVISFRS